MAGVDPGRRKSVSVAITTWAALLIITLTRQPLATRHCSRRSPYWAPEAPVKARLITGELSATTLLQFGDQFAVNTTEATVTHDHNVAGFRQLVHGPGNQGVNRLFHGMVVQLAVLGTPAVHQFRQPAHLAQVTPEYPVCRGGTGNQGLLMHALLHGVGPGLDNGKDGLITHLVAQAFQGQGNGRGVMGKVVIHPHTTHLTHQLHAPLYTGEPAQGSHGMVRRYAHMRSEEHTSELQSRPHLVCRLLL